MAREHGLVRPGDFPSKPWWFSHYKRSKWMAERCALEWAGRGLPVIVASPTSPIGAEDELPTPTGRIVADFLNSRFPAVSRTGLNFICVEQCAAGIHAAAQRGRTGARYLIGGSNLWLADFIALLARQSGRAVPRLTAPWPLIAAAGAIGEAAGLFFKTGERICLETAYYARKVQFFCLAKTRDELGWEAGNTLEPAAQRAIEWFRANPGPRSLPETRNLSLTDAVAP
jgi:dihydroflavonol-4-reductase